MTRAFPIFLGLRLVPVGVWFLGIALASPFLGRFPSGPHVVLLALAVAAIWPIHLWYRRHYGVVEQKRLGLGRSWPLLIGLVLAMVALSLGAPSFGGSGGLVLLLVLILFTGAVAFALPRGFGAGLVAGTAIAGIGILGAAVMLNMARDPLAFNSLGAVFSLAVGATLCAAGVIEHRLLAGSMTRPGAGEDV